MSNNADFIFERWKASLRSKDRSKHAVAGNFDELFEDLKKEGIDFNAAHVILSKAIKAHLPPSGVARHTYKLLCKNPNFAKSEKEFIEDWHQGIADTASDSFYAFFKIREEDVEDDGPKIYGNMSAREYAKQRHYADSIPKLDTRELERQWKEAVYNSEEDLLNVLGELNGKTNK